jgi:hypothetical protein
MMFSENRRCLKPVRTLRAQIDPCNRLLSDAQPFVSN